MSSTFDFHTEQESEMSVRQSTNVRVTTADTELQFGIQPKTIGKALFDQVIATTGIRESWYFGLQFTDTRGNQGWLDMDKKVLKQDLKKESPFRFEFKFKHFPENVADEVIQDVTLKHLFVQVRIFFYEKKKKNRF